ncbi:MAG TPA: ATP-binding protein, partial [Dissulfurispiraceae bacterium]|nr:ATP-binding protein [Dissulfurispiraceae bacterium]
CSFLSLISPEGAEQTIAIFEAACRGILGHVTFESTMMRAPEGSFPAELSLRVVKIESATLAVVDIRNITARLRAETALRTSEERYRTLFEESKDAIYISAPDGTFIDINQAGIDLLGCRSRDEALSLNLMRDLVIDPHARAETSHALSEAEFIRDFELAIRRKSGEKIDVLLTATAMRDDRGAIAGYRGMLRNITEHKRLEQQLMHSQKMEAIGTLTAGIAHDFNNILTSILGYATMLQLRTPDDSPLRPNIKNIIISSDRAASLIRRLLSFSRQQPLSMQPLDASEIIITTGELIHTIIGTDIELKVLPHLEQLLINADRGQLEQVIVNLATNARDAMPNGGILTLQSEPFHMNSDFVLRFGYGEPGDYVLLSVSDTGSGINGDIMRKLFEPFFTTKEVGKGTGLGLSIVYGIVKQHGGFINVESAAGHGASFRIYLPLMLRQPIFAGDPE